MSRKQLATASLLALWTAAGTASSMAAELVWEVESPFRLFKTAQPFAMHENAFKAIRGELARGLTLTSDRFGFEPEVTAQLAKAGARIFEVPISYSGRTYAEGKKIGWKDGIAAFWHIFRFNVLA